MEKGRFAKRSTEFTGDLANDVQFTWRMMEDEKIKTQGRRFLAGAMNYILTQLDLIPDHEKAGAVDDAMVIRIAWGLAAEHAGDVSSRDAQDMARLCREEEEISDFVGQGLFAKLRRYVLELADKTVRGRTTDQIIADAKVRAEMKKEIDLSMKKLRAPIAMDATEQEELERSIMSYLKMKLGG
jgi:uncharacterized membrane protein YkvA (DUF1232 family)